MASKKFRTPKGCWVRNAHLTSKGAEISYDCSGPGSGGSGHFPLPDGSGFSNYRKASVKNVRAIDLDGASVHGHGAAVDFVLSPRSAKCRTDGTTLRCIIK